MLKGKKMFLVLACMSALLLLSIGSAWGAYYDDNKDFFNKTGQKVNDLHLILDGEYTVTNYFDGYSSGHRFGNHSSTTGGGITNVTFDTPDSDIDDGEMVHVGIHTEEGGAKIVAAYWTQDGQFVAMTVAFSPTIDLRGLTPHVVLANTIGDIIGDPMPVNFGRAWAALVDVRVRLEELNYENLSQALAQRRAQLIPVLEGPVRLDPGQSIEFDLPLPVRPGQFVILVYETSMTDDPENRVINFIQTQPTN